MSNVGRWAAWYDGVTEQQPYARTATYNIAAEWLWGLDVEDWGSGYGYYRNVHVGGYTAVDGTETPWTDVVDDLVTRRSTTEAVLLRHVLEHNPEPDWRHILVNALASATKRVVVVVFTPESKRRQAVEIGRTRELDVPDMALPWRAIDAAFAGWDILAGDRRWWDDIAWFGVNGDPWTWRRETHTTSSFYGVEAVWLAERRDS